MDWRADLFFNDFLNLSVLKIKNEVLSRGAELFIKYCTQNVFLSHRADF